MVGGWWCHVSHQDGAQNGRSSLLQLGVVVGDDVDGLGYAEVSLRLAWLDDTNLCRGGALCCLVQCTPCDRDSRKCWKTWRGTVPGVGLGDSVGGVGDDLPN